MRSQIIFCGLFLLFALPGRLAAEEVQPKAVCASKLAVPPTIDGKLAEGEWAGAGRIESFVAENGLDIPVREQTSAFVACNENTLFVAFRCEESQMSKIAAKITKQNGNVWGDDSVEIFVDTKTVIHQFIVNSLGTQWDNTPGKKGGWEAKAGINEKSWVVEAAIPFAKLGGYPAEGTIWGFNLCRSEKPRNELSCWSATGGSFLTPSRFGQLVCGTFAAPIVQQTQKLTASIETLLAKKNGTPVSAQTSRTGKTLLKKINGLADFALKKDTITTDCYAGMRSRLKNLEKETSSFKAAFLRETIGGKTAGDRMRLTPPEASAAAPVPNAWLPKKICGKDFWLNTCYDPLYWKNPKIWEEPFLRESLIRFWPKREGDWMNTLFLEPNAERRKFLENTQQPFCIESQGEVMENPDANNQLKQKIPPETFQKFLKKYGDRFAGFTTDECFHCRAVCWEKLGLPLPKNREEAFRGFVAAYSDRNNASFRSWALCQEEFRPWNACGTATYLDHCILELGAPMSGEEIGSDEICTPMQLAFSRGAARQYGKPWRTYVSVWLTTPDTATNESVNHYLNRLSPEECLIVSRPGEENKWRQGVGPYYGASLSLQKRQLFASYMAGTTIYQQEVEATVYLAGYDYRDIHTVDPLVKVLRDKPYCLSPAGVIRKEFYDNIVKKHERGTPYTPVALIFDRHHGFVPEYSRDRIWNMIPFSAADYMMRAVNNAIFPWEECSPRERQTQVSGPFGDIFDVLTNNASLETLKNYQAALLVGDVTLDAPFAARLLEYVQDGGTLMLNAKQAADQLPEKFLGCKITGRRGKASSSFSLLDGTAIVEKSPFEFPFLESTTAKLLVKAADAADEEPPLVLSNQHGKGRVILTAPDYMRAMDTKTQMLNLFDHLMRHLGSELRPVDVEGQVEFLINRNASGWVVTLINNEGVLRPLRKKEIILPEKNQAVRVILKPMAFDGKIEKPSVKEWLTGEALRPALSDAGTEVRLTVPAGDVRIVEFKTDRQ
ncbi:MAG: sugar-binding protein [Verrucomicrobiae bacterium]|nr:sugar-binding protein [Verrucomicrobiae bacterium]